MKANKYICGLLITSVMLSNNAFNLLPHKVYASQQQTRISGANRYETSKAIALSGWENGAETVILASGEVFADALSSAALAAKYNAPVLVTESKKLSEGTKQALQQLGPKNVIIIGGPVAISNEVETQIKNILQSTEVKRINGADRYETSVKVAQEIGNVNEAFVVTGEKLPDAMTASSIAARKKMPIILTKKNSMPQSVVQYINNSNINKYYVIGGNAVIENSALQNLNNYERIAGANRYETNAKFIDTFKEEFDTDKIYFSGGQNDKYADSIPGSVLAAKDWAPIVFTKPNLDESTKEIINKLMSSNSKVVAFGGTVAISNETLQQVKPQYQSFENGIIGSQNANTPETYNTNVELKGVVTLRNAVVNGNVYVMGQNVNLENVIVNGTIFVDMNGISKFTNTNATEIKVLEASEVEVIGEINKIKVETRNNKSTPNIVLNNAIVNNLEVKSTVNLSVKGSVTVENAEVKEFNRQNKELNVQEGTLNTQVKVSTSAVIKTEPTASIAKVSVEKENVVVNVDGSINNLDLKAESNINLGSNASVEINVDENVSNVNLNVDEGANVTVSPEVDLDEKINISGEGQNNIKYFNVDKFANELVTYINENYTMKHFEIVKSQDKELCVIMKDVEQEDNQTLSEFYNIRKNSGVLRNYYLKAEEFANQHIRGFGDLKIEIKDKLALKGITLDSDFDAILNVLRNQNTIIQNIPNASFNGVNLAKVEFGSSVIYENNVLDLALIKTELSLNKAIETATISDLKQALNGKTIKLTFENGQALTLVFEK